MKKELDSMIIYYTEKDMDYIDELADYVNNNCKEILDFFDILQLDKKVNVYFHNSVDEFREKCMEFGLGDENGNVPLWICGFKNYLNDIHTLCLEEYRKTDGHKNGNLNDLKSLILHEFSHRAYSYATKDDDISYSKGRYIWLNEGIATEISHQYDNVKLSFRASLDDMINGCNIYDNYHTMFVYTLETYGRDYVLQLVHDYDKLIEDTPKLFDEVKKVYGNKSGKSL